MNKYMLLLSLPLIPFSIAKAYEVSAPLKDMQKFYVQEFKVMDVNRDNRLSEEEYVTHQIKKLKEALLEEVAETNEKEEKAETAEKVEKADTSVVPNDELNTLGNVNETLQNMATYDIEEEAPLPPVETLDFDEEKIDGLPLFDISEEPSVNTEEPSENTEEPSENTVETEVEVSDTPSNLEMLVEAKAGDALKGIVENMTTTAEEDVTIDVEGKGITPQEENPVENQKIKMMMEIVKKTLPKKIDDITTWIDVVYENNEVAYIYQADVDVSVFSPEEQNLLAYSIKNEACTQATKQMCPKIKSTFIDKGLNMKIKYQDKTGTEISFCELNKETCK